MSIAGSLLYGFANLLHPRMLWLMLWPMLVSLALWGTVAIALWVRTAVWLGGLLRQWLEAAPFLGQLNLADATLIAAHVLLFLLFVPLVYLTALFILGVMSLFLVVIHLGFASATALASAMIPIVIAVLKSVATSGINVIGMTMLLQFVVSFGFILVVNAPQNMVAYGTDTFSARDFVRTGLVLTVIALALVMLLAATYWRWLGYV